MVWRCSGRVLNQNHKTFKIPVHPLEIITDFFRDLMLQFTLSVAYDLLFGLS